VVHREPVHPGLQEHEFGALQVPPLGEDVFPMQRAARSNTDIITETFAGNI